MKLTKDEQTLYDFFCQVGVINNSVDYPLVLINTWASGNQDGVVADYDKKAEILKAYSNCIIKDCLDKPLYLAIKKIKGWK